jgi:hypothetical protein
MKAAELRDIFLDIENDVAVRYSLCISIEDHAARIRPVMRYIFDHSERSAYYWGANCYYDDFSPNDRLNGLYLLREYIISEGLYKKW